jgi:hypothetical protein
MSRRSRRSTTAASSSATQTAIRQDRDAGAVKRLLTGKATGGADGAAAADGGGKGGGGAGSSAKGGAAVPFTCYRCGQPLTGSLEDRGAHPCLSGVKEQRPAAMKSSAATAVSATAQRGDLQGALAAKQQPLAPTNAQEDAAAKPAGLPAVGCDTATPATGNSGWARRRNPTRGAGAAARTVGQARSDILKRALPGPDEHSPKRHKPNGNSVCKSPSQNHFSLSSAFLC